MTPSPQDFHEQAVAATDAEGRLPLPEQAMWEIFPFEPRKHLDLGDLDDAMAAEFGVLSVRMVRAVEALDAVGRVHLYRLGDGGAHLRVFPFGRPAGMLQLRGSGLTLWEEMLPVLPAEDRVAVLAVAVDALADLGESRL